MAAISGLSSGSAAMRLRVYPQSPSPCRLPFRAGMSRRRNTARGTLSNFSRVQIASVNLDASILDHSFGFVKKKLLTSSSQYETLQSRGEP
jgi:hypothetical protein